MDCSHEVGRFLYACSGGKQTSNSGSAGHQARDTCPHCGAIRIDKQLGLEQTPEEYVENMVQVFREVWRVLRDDGTLWLNLGDSYAANRSYQVDDGKWTDVGNHKPSSVPIGLKPKDLVGIPWRVALALQADGWYLRNDIIWHKPNPMPESVRDRCTKSHEYIFLLTKNKKYYYDNEAIKEDSTQHPTDWAGGEPKRQSHVRGEFEGKNILPGKEAFRTITSKRNKRTVWTITTKPYKCAHYATFPPELPEVCIKAGTSEAGKCPECGDPFERIIEKSDSSHDGETESSYKEGTNAGRIAVLRQAARAKGEEYTHRTITTGWAPRCDCGKDPIPCMVLDPFAGSGTTCMVARDLGRDAVGLDLSLDYLINNARKRLELDKLDDWQAGPKEVESNIDGLPMFNI